MFGLELVHALSELVDFFFTRTWKRKKLISTDRRFLDLLASRSMLRFLMKLVSIARELKHTNTKLRRNSAPTGPRSEK